MCEENYTALEIEVIKDFKKEFDFDLLDEHFIRTKSGLEISYYDYDLNKIDAYRNSPIIESCEIEYDGRESYIKIFTNIEYEDYFG